MRGRVNTDLFSGIALNATVVTKEVESGQSIVAGNFVQYKTVSYDIEIGSTTIKKLLKYDEGLFIANYNDYTLKLLKFDGVHSEVLDTYINEPIYDFNIDENGHILGITKYSTSATDKGAIRTIDIVDNAFVARTRIGLDTYSITNGSIYIVRGLVYTLMVGSGSNPHLYVNILSDNDGVLTKVTTQDDSSSTYRTYAGGIVVGGYAYNFYQTNDSSYKYLNCAKTYFGNNSVSVSVTTLIDRVPIGNINGWGARSLYGNKFMMTRNENDIVVIDTNMNVAVYHGSFDFSILDGKLHQIENNKILVCGNKTCIAELDDELVSVNQLSNKITASHNLFRENDNEFIYFTDGQVLSAYSYSSDYLSLSQPIDVDYVRNWDGNYKLIGVAKQSGVAGDTIEVYIPSSQY